MTERIVRPVRTWADYDEWSVFIDHYTALDQTRWYYDAHLVPKGAEGACTGHGGFREIADFFRNEPKPLGPLRSLRILYENGWWLRLEPLRGPTTTAIHDWLWYLHQEQDAPEIPHGQFTDDKDSEAVERAMIAAAAWFSQRQD